MRRHNSPTIVPQETLGWPLLSATDLFRRGCPHAPSSDFTGSFRVSSLAWCLTFEGRACSQRGPVAPARGLSIRETGIVTPDYRRPMPCARPRRGSRLPTGPKTVARRGTHRVVHLGRGIDASMPRELCVLQGHMPALPTWRSSRESLGYSSQLKSYVDGLCITLLMKRQSAPLEQLQHGCVVRQDMRDQFRQSLSAGDADEMSRQQAADALTLERVDHGEGHFGLPGLRHKISGTACDDRLAVLLRDGKRWTRPARPSRSEIPRPCAISPSLPTRRRRSWRLEPPPRSSTGPRLPPVAVAG